MIEASVLLLTLAIADLMRAVATGAAASRLIGGVGAAFIATGAGVLLGVEKWAVVLAFLVSFGWVLLVDSAPKRIWPAIAIASIVGALAALYPSHVAPMLVLVEFYEGTALYDAGISLMTFVVGLACLLFLTRSANLIARAAIRVTRRVTPLRR